MLQIASVYSIISTFVLLLCYQYSLEFSCAMIRQMKQSIYRLLPAAPHKYLTLP